MNVTRLELLIAFVAIVALVILIDFVIVSVAENRTKDFMNSLFYQEERVSLDDPYEFLRIQQLLPAGSKKTKIAVITSGAATNQFTSRQRITPMSISLVERGYDVTLFVPCWNCSGEGLRWKEVDAIPVVRVGAGKFSTPHFDIFLFMKLLRKVLVYNPDILYCSKPIRYGGAMAMAVTLLRSLSGRLSKIKVVVDSDDWEGRGGWADRGDSGHLVAGLRDWQERFTLRHCDIVTTSTTFLRNRAIKLRGGSESVYLVSNGIRPELWPIFPVKPSPPQWLTSELSKLGNPKLLLLYTRYIEVAARDVIEILSSVLAIEPDVALLVVGSSFDIEARTQRLELLSLAREAGIEDSRIIVGGWVPYRELAYTWSVADVAICPYNTSLISQSRFPTKILELMAAGQTIVANNVGDIPQIIEENKSGLLVSAGDLKSFSERVVWLLQNPGTRRKLGEAAQERAHKVFNWQVLVRDLEVALAVDLQI